MNFQIIIPTHNEEAFLAKTLQSIVEQTILPNKIIVVNDSSTDGTQEIIDSYSGKYHFIKGVYHDSEKIHSPGNKVVEAFYAGFKHLQNDFDLIGKFDADLILPPDYFEKIVGLFKSNSQIGLASGLLYIQKGDEWVFENISEKDKVRGPIKLYRKACFNEIGGLKKAIGWDTVDTLLATYHGWKTATDKSLHVKHLKPTGASYTKNSRFKQGEAFYRMRYGFLLTFIAAGKLTLRKRDFLFLFDTLKGYFKAKKDNKDFLVTEAEGKFIRNYRQKRILSKLFFRN